MATFTKLSRLELEEIARARYRQVFPDGPPVRRSRARNIGPALRTMDAERLEIAIGRRRYELLPVSFEDGLRLLQARQAIEDMEEESVPKPETIRAYRDALRVVVRLAPRYLAPRGPLRRLLWRLRIRRNPVRRATEAELGQMLGFFLGCRMSSRVRYPGT